MDELLKGVRALSQWAWTIFQVQVPFLGVSLWLLALTLFVIRMLFKVSDVATHRNQSGAGMESNNNRIYRRIDEK